MINYEYTPESRARLSIVLQATGLKQFELARQIGMSPASLSHIMSADGRHGKITENLADAIVAAFPEQAFDRNWLLTGEPPVYEGESQGEQGGQHLQTGEQGSLQMGLFDNIGFAFASATAAKPVEQPKPVEVKPQPTQPKKVVNQRDSSNSRTKDEGEKMTEKSSTPEQQARPFAEPRQQTKAESAPAPRIVNIAIFYSDGSFKMFTPQGECVAERRANG